MAKITKVPDGPLVKKKGPFKGSTLKAGGKIKKAQGGEYITQNEETWNGKKTPAYTATKKVKTKNGPRYYQGKSPDMSFARELAFDKQRANPADSIPKAKLSARALEVMNQKNGGKVKKAQLGTLVKKGAKAVGLGTAAAAGASSASSCSSGRCFHKRGGWTSGSRSPWRKNGGTVKKAKAGAMIKRADGSTSQRGLWDNIRANKGSGKKPTAAMLKQEKKIKAKK